jgi:microcystin-dependent protein
MEPPIGSISAFAGALDPGPTLHAFETSTGGVLCDGRLLDGNDPNFLPLFNVIRFGWGGDSDTNRFNIPDLQGRFLRGVEREQGRAGRRDPDGDSRLASNQGATKAEM